MVRTKGLVVVMVVTMYWIVKFVWPLVLLKMATKTLVP